LIISVHASLGLISLMRFLNCIFVHRIKIKRRSMSL
jgi:hypothetical protein